MYVNYSVERTDHRVRQPFNCLTTCVGYKHYLPGLQVTSMYLAIYPIGTKHMSFVFLGFFNRRTVLGPWHKVRMHRNISA